ncbi:MAG: UDP-N-acetylmuramate dehydrogenase [Bacteroidales bacterium]|nr:UDP-N-acetylmuramate dehydrogenase [Fournierella massiliensis]MCF2556389.1 UDP-N-acetylmuramate dehydrogenase [Fournierella massiliensis]MCI6739844.1 UDP-N-acetylmuramate dehydrogenase [Bacteroidales bacterium]
MDQLKELREFADQQGIAYAANEPLKKYTSFHIGGPAALFCRPADQAQLAGLLNFCRRQGVRSFVLGMGTNVLFSDEGYEGAVISTRGMREEIGGEGDCLTAGCGVPLNRLCQAAAGRGLGGLEFAYGIPGSLGGGIYMNAGAYGGEMKDVLEEVRFLDEEGCVRTLPAGELGLGYRASVFAQKPWYILEARLRLKPATADQVQKKMEELLARRKEKQPLEYPSAGSTFKRPEGAFAAALIEQCGLKGYRVGDAAVSEKHSGFVVNLGQATCEQVLQVARDVQRIVQEKTGYLLEKEIRVIR